jgi:hypothetical protein
MPVPIKENVWQLVFHTDNMDPESAGQEGKSAEALAIPAIGGPCEAIGVPAAGHCVRFWRSTGPFLAESRATLREGCAGPRADLFPQLNQHEILERCGNLPTILHIWHLYSQGILRTCDDLAPTMPFRIGRAQFKLATNGQLVSIPWSLLFLAHRSFAYSALACLRIGTSGSASFHNLKNC